jgi:hypothetical protein
MDVRRPHRRATLAAVAGLLALALAASPRPAGALPLLGERLTLGSDPERPALAVALAAEPRRGDALDFDLLGAPTAPTVSADDALMRRRAKLLRVHQGVGLGLLGLQLATTVVGQLNYSDKYANGPVTGRYELSHSVLAYATLGVFALNGTLALLAPRPPGKQGRGLDRVTVHKLGMLAATVGMLAQAGLGIYADRREGYLDQERYATAHLAIGYATFAAVGVAVGALVF